MRSKKPNFHEFHSTCFVLNDMEHMRKFDAKSDEGIFLGYSPNSCAYKVFTRRTKMIMESIYVIVDDQESTSFEIRKDDA